MAQWLLYAAGDFYGDNYTEEDFGYRSDGDDDDLENEGSDDDDPTAQDHHDASYAGLEDGYEVPRAPVNLTGDKDTPMPDVHPEANAAPTREARKFAEDRFHHKPIVERYPGHLAGKPISTDLSQSSEETYRSSLNESTITNPYAPFKSKVDWEIAKWAKFRGITLACWNVFARSGAIRNSLHTSSLLRKKHYIDKGKTIQMYLREAVERDHPGATIIPIIISSDKTQLTVFGQQDCVSGLYDHWEYSQRDSSKTIPPRLCFTWLSSHIPDEERQKQSPPTYPVKCISRVHGAYFGSSEGGWRHWHSDDFRGRESHAGGIQFTRHLSVITLKQVLVTAVKTGECPTCEAPRDELGQDKPFPLRDLEAVLTALESLDQGPTIYAQACADAGIKPIYHPFWEGLPYTNIFQAISPDILHQLYQGIVKHLIPWLTACCGEAEIDARCRRLPPNHNIRLFMNGITNLSRVTGKEHDQIWRFLLSLVIDVQLPDGHSSSKLVGAVRGLLDFVYLAQYPMHTSETLAHLENALQRFHDHKSILLILASVTTSTFPNSTFAATISYLAKEAYRSTNFKDEFPQMTLWLERKEKMYRHEKFIQWRLDGCPPPPVTTELPPGLVYERQLKITKHPTLKSVRLTRLVADYGATFFHDALARYVVHLNDPELSRRQVEEKSNDLGFSFNSVPVYHRIKFTTPDPYTLIRYEVRNALWSIPFTFNRAKHSKVAMNFLLVSTQHW
ncbi:hypothetical protein B0H14DRAFT_3163444 [Mycena olivaceomarginata]|nr:hypothetical protein B0H14DRAFT_3163444 [Mycena olivaceomarginata]